MNNFGKPQPGIFVPNQNLSDYGHASKLFRPNNMELLPKQSFLFHVFFEIDPVVAAQINATLRTTYDARFNVGLLAKRVQLPRFNIDTKVYNAYNRKNIIQQKIKYDPVSITIHDDSANIARNLWLDYYNWYYADARNRSETTYAVDTKYDPRTEYDFGYSPRIISDPARERINPGLSQIPFFRTVKIYSLHQKKYSEYILVNPIISQWQHGEHQQGQSEFMECSLSLEFETVIYNDNVPNNDISSELVKNFPPEGLYDQIPRPNTRFSGLPTARVPGASASRQPSTAEAAFNQIGRNLLNVVSRSVRNPSNFRNNFKNFVNSTATQAISGISGKITQNVLSQQRTTDRFFTPSMSERIPTTTTTQTDQSVVIPSGSGSVTQNGITIK
jgi:hypothetical protein